VRPFPNASPAQPSPRAPLDPRDGQPQDNRAESESEDVDINEFPVFDITFDNVDLTLVPFVASVAI